MSNGQIQKLRTESAREIAALPIALALVGTLVGPLLLMSKGIAKPGALALTLTVTVPLLAIGIRIAVDQGNSE